MIPCQPSPAATRGAILTAAALLVLAAPAARAVSANPDLEFLERRSAEVAELARTLEPQAGTTSGAFEAMRQILTVRAEALRELSGKLPLTTFDGIETQDRYDVEVVRALDGIVTRGRAAEDGEPPQEDAVYFSVLLGDLLPLGKAPVGFMVLEHANLAVSTADALDNDPAISQASARKLAIRLSDRALSLYRETHADDLALHQSDSFRQSAVIVRLRCPTDGSTYRITGQKNKLGPNGAMSTLYYLKSNTTYEELILEFPLEYVTRLNQASERQELKDKPQPVKPTHDLEP